MADLNQLQKDWTELGKLDPLWAVLSDPSRQHNRWDDEEFFATGKEFVDQILNQVKEFGLPKNFNQALDFGCGVGRLTQALAGHFIEVTGVDISESMLTKANEFKDKRLGTTHGKVNFLHNTQPNLKVFANNQFDFVLTYIVLQHIASPELILVYIKEFVRILTKGGIAAFQVPTHVNWKNRIQLRRRVYAFLRALGVPAKILYQDLGLNPIAYVYVEKYEIEKAVTQLGGRVLRVDDSLAAGGSVTSSLFFVTKD